MITIAIIIITAGISILVLLNKQVFYNLTFNPYSLTHGNEYHRIITHGVIHADWIHLLINMFVLFSFGRMVETYYHIVFSSKSTFYFLILYVGAIIFSVIPSGFKHRNNPHYNSVGASGAVSAIIFASIVFEPLSRIYLFLIPIGIPAFVFGLLYLVYSAYMAKRGKDNIGHDAHFYGAIFGVLFTFSLKPELVQVFIHQILK